MSAIRLASRILGAARPVLSAAARPSTFTPLHIRSVQTITYGQPLAKTSFPAPSFTAGAVVDETITEFSLESYRGKWVALLFYPKDFTFVCPTEIIAFSDRASEFEAINANVVGVSIDSPEVHLAWVRTPRAEGGLGKLNIPLVADITKEISNQYGVLLEDAGIALRGLFLINPEGVIESTIINNLPVGRSVDEALRLIKAFQFVAENGEVCPANWQPGAKTMKAHPDQSKEYFRSVNN